MAYYYGSINNIDLFVNSLKRYSEVEIVKPESPGRDKKTCSKKERNGHKFSIQFFPHNEDK